MHKKAILAGEKVQWTFARLIETDREWNDSISPMSGQFL
jgi:hypothetical protein